MNTSSPFPPTTWRLIRSEPLAGAWNMAVDEAILEAVEKELAPPTLRLYAWNPPCISLGYAQKIEDIDLDRLQTRGWEVVRRPTGGRAILHTDELTYAVIAPDSEPRVAGSILESYQRLSTALLHALHWLQAPAQAKEHQPQAGTTRHGAPPGPICFEVPATWEITLSGKKLIGSAQARRKNGVLQHGTLPLHGDLARITEALRFPDETARQQAAAVLLQKATTLEQGLGRIVSWETAAEALVQGFQDALNVRLESGALLPIEEERAAQLWQEKYHNSAWNQRQG